MSLSPMVFDKDWTNPADFPTHETQESKVRADMQYLFNLIRDHFNNFITNELLANNVSFNPTPGAVTSDNLQDAVEFLHQEIQDVTQGSVADGAITTSKLHQDEGEQAVTTATIRDGAVTTNKLSNGAVTAGKLANGAITGEKFADGSITQSKIAESSIGASQIRNYEVTENKLANLAVITRTIANAAITTLKIAAGAVTTEKLADQNVTSAKIADANVTSIKLAQNSVESAKIKAGAVTAEKLAQSSVETAKLAQGAVTHEKTTGIQKQHSVTEATIGAESWDTTTKKATVTVSGIKADSTTQAVTWTPDDDSWGICRNCGVRAEIQPSEDDSITFVCETIPSESISMHFFILD